MEVCKECGSGEGFHGYVCQMCGYCRWHDAITGEWVTKVAYGNMDYDVIVCEYDEEHDDDGDSGA